MIQPQVGRRADKMFETQCTPCAPGLDGRAASDLQRASPSRRRRERRTSSPREDCDEETVIPWQSGVSVARSWPIR